MKLPSGLLVLSDRSMVHILLLLSTFTVHLLNSSHRKEGITQSTTLMSITYCPACSPSLLSHSIPFVFFSPASVLFPFTCPLKAHHSPLFFHPWTLERIFPRLWKNLHQDLKAISFQIPGILFSRYSDQGHDTMWWQLTPSPFTGFHLHRNDV